MGELLDLILDFERKLLLLIKDLVVQPKKVANSIINKDKIYLGAFKFYTLATSAWIIFFQLGNKYFDFFSEDFVLPERLINYLQSEQDFAFLIAPFAGLTEFFIPFAVINWLLFRKRELSWLNHITLNIYIAGFLLIYALPWFLILFVLSSTSLDGGLINIIAYLSVIITPILYYSWVYLKIFGRKKFFSFAKPLCTVLAICYLSISFFLNEPFHELIHRKLFFRKYNQFSPVPDEALLSSYTIIDSLVRETPEKNFFAADLVHSLTQNTNASVLGEYDRNLMTYTYSLSLNSEGVTRNVALHSASFNQTQFFSISQPDTSNLFFVLQNNLMAVYSDTLKIIIIDQSGINSKPAIFTDHLNVLSNIVKIDSSYIFSGMFRSTKEPIVGRMNLSSNTAENVYTFNGMQNFFIDNLSTNRSTELQALMSHDDKGKLREVRWIHGKITNEGFKQTSEISLYKNEFSPTINFYNGFLHRSRLTNLNDSISIAAFQIMTDSSFAISMTKINTVQKKSEWSTILTLPADFSYNDELLADSMNIYLLGRGASVFHKGLTLDYYQLPYVLKINKQTGQSEGVRFLEMERKWTGYYLPNLESIYTMASTAYQDQHYIYWLLGGRHYYKIDKSKL
ncbi:MAG: hypothetical protein J0L67_10015 [Cytophagales bacterium]|nr:hypothetical protein [Cytophagales bacterium]